MPTFQVIDGNAVVNGKVFPEWKTNPKGFQMPVVGGWTISVQFGPCNYCSNRGNSYSWEADTEAGRKGSDDAEIAVFDDKGNWRNLTTLEADPNTDVEGYVTLDDIAALADRIRAKVQKSIA
jgi:hypothetical protein